MPHNIRTEWIQTYYLDLLHGWPKAPHPDEQVGYVTARLNIDHGSSYELLGFTFTHLLTFTKHIFFGKFPEYEVEIHRSVYRSLTEDEVPQEIHDAFNDVVGIDYTKYTYKTDGFDWL